MLIVVSSVLYYSFNSIFQSFPWPCLQIPDLVRIRSWRGTRAPCSGWRGRRLTRIWDTHMGNAHARASWRGRPAVSAAVLHRASRGPGARPGSGQLERARPFPMAVDGTGMSRRRPMVALHGLLRRRRGRHGPEGPRNPGVHPVGLRQRPAGPGKVAGLPGVGDGDVEAPVMEKPEDVETRPAPQRVPPP